RPLPPAFLKAAWLNPGGSVKDRAALYILRDGIARGELPAKRVLDSSSGNTAIAYAMLGAAGGIGVTVCVPANASAERKALLETYGAEVIFTDPLDGSDGAIRAARDLAAAQPHRYWYADQYNHPANARAHYLTTAGEIWRQTGGRITHLVAGLGTTGTLIGTGKRLRELNPEVELVAVQPDGPFHGLEGLKHLATAIVPGIYDQSVPSRTEFVATEDADAAVRRLARRRRAARAAREPADRRGTQSLSDRPRGVPARAGAARPRRARGVGRVPLTPRSPARAVGVRPRARLAAAQLRHRRGRARAGRRGKKLASVGRSRRVRSGTHYLGGTEGRMAVTVLIPMPLRPFVGGKDALELDGGSVGEV